MHAILQVYTCGFAIFVKNKEFLNLQESSCRRKKLRVTYA